MVASISAFGKGLDATKALLGGLQVKYNRGEAASFEESLVSESVGVLASSGDPVAPASDSAVDVEVVSHFPFGQQPRHVPLRRWNSPSPPPKPAEWIDLTSTTPSPNPVQATSPPDESKQPAESPTYSPASPASSPTP
eukprot:6896315-Prymnesium_polylepis.1